MITEAEIITFAALLITGYQDLKKREVHSIIFKLTFTLLLIICLYRNMTGIDSITSLNFLVPTFILTFFTRDVKIFGGADIDAFLLILGADPGKLSVTVGLACVMALTTVAAKVTDKDNIPFVTYLAIAYTLCVSAEAVMFYL